MPRHDIVILMGDFSANVGSSREELKQVAGLFTTAEETDDYREID